MWDENYWIARNATVIGDVFLDTDEKSYYSKLSVGELKLTFLY